MTGVAAVIVVAGGRSSRFGSDKLSHRVGDATLLERTVDAAGAAGRVVLVTAAEVPAGVAVAVSESPRWGGPCAAIAAGVDAVVRDALVSDAAVQDAPAGDVLILPADLADPHAATAALTAIEEGILTDADGHPQWLLARAPLAALERRAAELRQERGALDGLSARDLLAVVRGRHAVAGPVWTDIDTPDDLSAAGLPAPDATTLPPADPPRSHAMEPSELDAWADEAAAVVGTRLDPGDVAAVLDLARDAAHGIARPAAPLTTFIAGIAVGRGQPLAEAVAALLAAIDRRSS
ncbi:DUF6457 domain-containing protein [Leifsonia sp. 2TAF2]|uniref:DUF6457 domain-containing protein n=1 Tax=Leifsonia sp. 2TAF2 TaxID=3233009 RepID=UPI003F98A9CB